MGRNQWYRAVFVALVSLGYLNTRSSAENAAAQGQDGKIVMGYFTNWAQYRPGVASYMPEQMNSSLYTHVVFAFAGVDPESLTLRQTEFNDKEMYSRLQRHLRSTNPNIKVILAVGSHPSANRNCGFVGPQRGELMGGVARLPRTHETADPIRARFSTLEKAARACWQLGESCGGITKLRTGEDVFELRKGAKPVPGHGVVSYVKLCPNSTSWDPENPFEKGFWKTPKGAQAFANNAVRYAIRHGFDGIELHLNTPRPSSPHFEGTSRRERTKGSQASAAAKTVDYGPLITALRESISRFSRQELTLSLALTVDPRGSDQLLRHADKLDFVVLIGYDMAGCWQSRMSAQSPLHHDNAHEDGEFRHRMPVEGVSVQDALGRWDALGVPRGKIVLGIGLFGRSWSGAGKDLTLGSYGWCGEPGQWTREPGLLAYYEVVGLIRAGARTMLDMGSHTLYLSHKKWFVSFEAEMTIRKKMDFLLSRGLRGAALWSADLDDFVNGNVLSTYVSDRMSGVNGERP